MVVENGNDAHARRSRTIVDSDHSGIAPKPRKDTKGLGLGAGSLVSTAQIQGTLANPELGVNAANTAKTGAKIFGALATGGTSLLYGSLYEKVFAV